ncbi:amidase signature enzyme [Trichoderma camerunense]
MANVVELIWTSGTEGCIFSVSGVRYLASFPKPRPESCQAIRDLSLFTVFADPPTGNRGKRITKKWVKESLEEYRKDDVFDNAFLGNIIFYDGLMTGQPDVRPKGEALLQRSGKITMNFANKNDDLVPGPHILWNQQLWQVCKLVDDSYETCMVALKPQQNNVLSFAIPSRLKYSIPNQQLPLAGKRILIKDNIHLDGIKTSNGNRAFYETYPAQTQTASCIQKLIDKGVVAIGKTKMSSFGNWEEPIQYTDYPAPWNPRADRYQSPGGSSSGSASAVAAYEWLDIVIGTDTWGSVTRPAHWCGCFGLRPSLGAISADGIVPCVKPWDIPGILARNLEDCKHFAEEWLDFSNNKFKEYPQEFSCLLWPTDFWDNFEATEKEMAKKFAQNMADKLGICLEEFSFKDCWSKEGPKGWRKDSLQEFMKETTQAMAYDSYNNSEDFRTKYKQQRNGAEPYTSKPNEDTWSIGKNTSRQTRDNAFARIDVYQKWFKDHFFTDGRKKTISAIIVLPLDIGGPRYRDDCINALALGPVMGAPVLTVPIGQIPYHSRVSKRTEQSPFAVALMGSPGTDIKLIDNAIFAMGCLNMPTKVKTGKRMYDY